jgi:hypothetical protein
MSEVDEVPRGEAGTGDPIDAHVPFTGGKWPPGSDLDEAASTG